VTSFIIMLVLSLAVAALPGLIYLGLLRWMGLDRRQARNLLIAALAWGAAGGVGLGLLWTTFLEIPIEPNVPRDERIWIQTAFLAPMAEELAKAVYFVLLLRWRRIGTALLGLMYGLAIGLGFALTENFAYFLHVYVEGGQSAWIGTVLSRTFFSVSVHVTATGLWGGCLGFSRSSRSRTARKLLPYVGFVLALAVHICWNLSLTLFEVSGDALPLALGGVSVVVAVVVTLIASYLATRDERRMVFDELRVESQEGTLPLKHVALLASPIARLRSAWVSDRVDSRKYQDTALMLALRLRQRRAAVGGEAEVLDGLIDDLRDHVREILRIRATSPEISWPDLPAG